MYKIKIDGVERLVGLDAATTLALKLLSGSDFPKAWLFVEAFCRKGDTLAERHCWEFPRLTANAELAISIVDSGSPDRPDESDDGPGHLARDERIVVKEGIRRPEAAISELQAKRRTVEHGDEVKADPAPYCSFCGKSKDEAKHLIAGPLVFICDECIHICVGILATSDKDG